MTEEGVQTEAAGGERPDHVGPVVRRPRSSARAEAVPASLLAAALAVAVFWTGGVSVAALAVVLALVLLAWFAVLPIEPRRTPTATLGWLWGALGLWSLVALAPLPRSLVGLLHPRAVAISDAGRSALGLAPLDWLTIALAPGDAALQIALAFVAAAFAWVAAVVLSRRQGRPLARVFLRGLVLCGVLAALLDALVDPTALGQVVPASLRTTLRHFVLINPNHQAGFLNLCLAIALGLVARARSAQTQTIWALPAALIGGGVLATGSRGGILCAALVVLAVGATVPRRSRHMRVDPRKARADERQRLLLKLLSVAVVCAMLALPLIEVEFGLGDAAMGGSELKTRLLPELVAMVGASWLTGMGPGSLPVAVSQDFLDLRGRLDFAENIVAQRIVDGGVLFGLVFCALLAWRLWRVAREGRASHAVVAAVVALGAVLVQNLVDFSLEVAGVLLPFMAVAVTAERIVKKSVDSDATARPPRTPQRGRRRALGAAMGALILAAMLLVQARSSLTRDIDQILTPLDWQQARTAVADNFLYDHHAFYVLGRKMLEARLPASQVRPVFERVVDLRPSSAHGRLFRLAARLESADPAAAADDLVVLLSGDEATRDLALDVCARSAATEAVLVTALTRVPEYSYDVAVHFEATNPALVERLAIVLRTALPGRRHGIEVVRGRLYLKRDLVEPAERIASELLAHPETEDIGWILQADILAKAGRHYEAWHLYRAACERGRKVTRECLAAMRSILAAERPDKALTYIQRQWPRMRVSAHGLGLYWTSMARAQLQAGRAYDAIDSARRAVGFQPGERGGAILLATALLGVGDRGQARRVLEPLRGVRAEDPVVDRLWEQAESINPLGVP